MNKKSLYSGLGRLGLAAAGLLIATLNLSAELVVTAHIPFAFDAAGKSLPAGDYSISPVGPGVVLVTGARPSDHAFVLYTNTPSNAGSAGIDFDRSGAIPQLAGVHVASESWHFITPAASKLRPVVVALRSRK